LPRHVSLPSAAKIDYSSIRPDLQSSGGSFPVFFGIKKVRASVLNQPRNEHFGVPIRDALLEHVRNCEAGARYEDGAVRQPRESNIAPKLRGLGGTRRVEPRGARRYIISSGRDRVQPFESFRI